MRLKNDFLHISAWPSFSNGYYTANMEPMTLKEQLEEALKEENLDESVQARIRACLSSLDENGNKQVLTVQQAQLSYRHSCFMEPEYDGGCILRAAFVLQEGEQAEIQQEMDRIIGQRQAKQPLEYPSAGSTFQRPQGAYASQLIDECGLRGTTVGGAQVSTKHAGFVINIGSATCRDVLELADRIRECVKEKTGYELELEVRRLP